MNRRPSAIALVLALSFPVVAGACGSSSIAGDDAGARDAGTDAATTDAGPPDSGPPDAGPPPPSAQPPPRPSAGVPSGDGATFVISHIHLGDADRDGTASPSAWQSFGYDLDHRTSTAASTDVCMPRAGASPSSAYPDGVDGTDNSFGRNLLPIFLGLASDFSARVNERIAAGDTTHLVTVDVLGTASDATPLSGGLVRTIPTGAPPLFDGSDVLDVDPASLTSPSEPLAPIASFDDGYLAGDTFVAMPAGRLELVLATADGFAIPLVIDHAIVTMDVAADRSGATLGTIAGIMPIDELTAAFRSYAGRFDPSLCSGPTIESIIAQIEQAADIMADGTQDPTVPCDGISIGIGFEAVAASIGAIGAPQPPPGDPCAPPP